ncbi:MAG: peptidylprolyl isomerase [Mariniblastus sp.]
MKSFPNLKTSRRFETGIRSARFSIAPIVCAALLCTGLLFGSFGGTGINPASAGNNVAAMQDATEPPEIIDVAEDPFEGMTEAQLAKMFDQAIAELRVAVKEAKHAEAIHFHVDSQTALEYRALWEDAAARGQIAYKKVIDVALAYFVAAEKPSNDLNSIILETYPQLYAEGKLEVCSVLTKKLKLQFPDNEALKTEVARVSVMTNDFEPGVDFLKTSVSTVRTFPQLEQNVFFDSPVLLTNWEEELKIREAEAAADDLPRVELKTSKGTVIIELFENEAPETVGNFINLVEAGFYDDIIFHRSIKNFLAHAGRMTFNRLQPVGYTIYDEHKKPNARHHFRGSVSMVTNPEKENSGSSEFYLVRSPFSTLDKFHTVFGRVISDMRVVDAFQLTRTMDDDGKEEGIKDVTPDMIISARVLRKRDHDYEPNRVK